MTVTPARALDPNVMLATSIHAQPGVYALLLGSGVSTGAGIPTGWGVITQLIRRAAAARHPENESAADQAAADPDAWWAEHGDGESLGYSNLLAALGATPAARQALLRTFFEPSEEDLEQGNKTPSDAHRAIAALVKRGAVRVIVTTNFDRLMERALEDVGVSPQIIATPDAVAGMTPLAHSPATIIKLHGDYTDLQMRNTVDELDTYPEAWDRLLDRVFDEYGLIISGWSADWDKALVAAMQRCASRRYPLYWDARSGKGETARALLAQHRGVLVAAPSADELFKGLEERLAALDRLSEAPLTTALAVQRLKRFLPDPVRRVDLYDLVMGQTESLVRFIADQPINGLTTWEHGDEIVTEYTQRSDLLIRLVTTGVQHDTDGRFTWLWVEVVQRLLNARGPYSGAYDAPLERLRHLPALLVSRAIGMTAIDRNRPDVLIAIWLDAKWTSQYAPREPEAAVVALDEYDVLSHIASNLPRWNGTKKKYPPSHLLRELLQDPLGDVLDEAAYKRTSDTIEFLRSLAMQAMPAGRPTPGEFLLDGAWDWDREEPSVVRAFRAAAESAGESWPWWRIVDKPELDALIKNLWDNLKTMRVW